MTTTLGSIGQIHVTVADVPGAVAFFRNVLGLPLLFEVPEQSMAFSPARPAPTCLTVPFSREISATRPSGNTIFFRTSGARPVIIPVLTILG
jgi:catechol 2,3-dioxygenase-like lactoylglutathione lyase family enzyme